MRVIAFNSRAALIFIYVTDGSMGFGINEGLSTKLKALSLVAIILVVFIHSYNKEVKFTSGESVGELSDWVLFFENFFSHGVARIATPLFFAISGFLFYASFEFTPHGVFDKLKKRFKSLFIPYLFWSVSGLILIFLLQIIPWSRNFFTRELIIHYSFSEIVSTILLNPIPYQLWFVRDLIMLMVFSPLIWYLTKSIRGVWLITLLLLWMVDAKTFELFSNEALLFFTIGCALALDLTGAINKKISKTLSYYCLAVWLFIVFLTSYIITFGGTFFSLNILHNIGILIGILAVWSLYDHVNQDKISKYSIFLGYSFFIFVFHEPLLTILKKGMFFLLGKTSLSTLIIYLIAPLVTIGLSMLFRYALRKYTPRFYDFATGGR